MAAGVVAGAAGSAGGITSLVSYPALLAVGIGPLAANVTNAVAGLTLGIGATLSSRAELSDQWRRLRRWAPVCVAGGSAGGVLLLLTPSSVFDWAVPFLVAGAALALLMQPRLAHRRRARPNAPLVAVVAMASVAVYSGYFGAGAGIMILAVLAVVLEHDLVRANALKNILLTVTDAVPALIFALAGRVVWLAALPLAVGLFAGGTIGPPVARRAPPRALRIAIGCCGFALASWLLVRAAG